jgi:hypothetical protein
LTKATRAVLAERGDMPMVLWLEAHGCAWDEGACGLAAAEGELGLLQWLRGCGCPWEARVRSLAVLNDHVACAEWAEANGRLPVCARGSPVQPALSLELTLLRTEE